MPTTQHKVNDSTVEAVLALILASPDPEVVAQLCELMLTYEVPESAIKARCIQPLTQGLFQLAGCLSVNEPACLGMLCVLAVYVGPSLPGQLLGTAESLTLDMAPLVLRAWGFGAYVACKHGQSLDCRWTDAEAVGHPLATLAEAVSDVSVLCGLIEALVAVLDLVPCPCCAGAQRLCTLVCTSLVRLGEHPSCPPHRLGSAAQDALHALRKSRRLFGIQLLPGCDNEAVECCPLLLSRLEKLVYQTDDFQALFLRVLARAHTASEVIKVVCRSQPGRAPLMLGTVVQEAVLGLRPFLCTLDQGAHLGEVALDNGGAARSTLALFRCWLPLPTEATLQATGERMQAAVAAAPTATDWQFFCVVGLLLGWPAMLQVVRPSVLPAGSPASLEALRRLLLLDPHSDAAASLVPVALSLWPLAQPEATLWRPCFGPRLMPSSAL